jgi:hypothetical protein
MSYLIKLIVPSIKPTKTCILSNQLVRSSPDKAVLRKRNRSRKTNITTLNIIGYGWLGQPIWMTEVNLRRHRNDSKSLKAAVMPATYSMYLSI